MLTCSMSHVHYKFSSKLSYDTVVFDDPNITLSDLKRQIMGREKLRAGDCDLQIVNAQNKEEYTDDQSSIPKGSSVIVRRIPFSGVKSNSSGKTHNTGRSDSHHNFGAFKAVCNQIKPLSTPRHTHLCISSGNVVLHLSLPQIFLKVHRTFNNKYLKFNDVLVYCV